MKFTSLSVAIISVSVVFIVLCTAAVALRIQARRTRSLPLKGDDYTILAALVVNVALCASEIWGAVKNGDGRPLSALTTEESVAYLKLVYGSFFVAQLALTLVKISVVLFYKRVFATKGFQTAANIMTGIITLWFISFFFADLFSAWPIQGHWDRKVYHPTINYDGLLVSTAAISMALDVIILCMPLPVVSGLQMSFKRKVVVMGIFWLGLFCVVSSAVRLYFINAYTTYKGNPNRVFTAQLTEITIWSIVESCMAVITACLPTYGPLFKGGRSTESLIHSIRAALSSRGKSLFSNSSKSTFASSSEKGRSESSDSRVHITSENKGTRRDQYEMMGSSVGNEFVDRRDLEAQRAVPGFMNNIERNF